MTTRIFLKIVFALIVLLALVLLGVDYYVTRIAEKNLRQGLQSELKEQAQLAVALLRDRPTELELELVKKIAEVSGARLTLIRPNGVVMLDSEFSPTTIENQSTYPEIARALAGEIGSSTRVSLGMEMEFLYVAVPNGKGALRLALPLLEVQIQRREIRARVLWLTLWVFVSAVLLVFLLARHLSFRLSQIISFAKGLARGAFQTPVPTVVGAELGEVGLALQTMANRLRSIFEQLQDERSRFSAAINGIGAGVLVVDLERRVVVRNPAMRRMFPHEDLAVGDRPFVESHPDIAQLFDRVFTQGVPDSLDFYVTQPVERTWKVSCSPVGGVAGRVRAVVVIFYDITELEETEKVRRDFVANVSHELRTPLASIQGYSETLLEGALDDPQHNRRFLEIIRQNAKRLAQLSSDLMTLSQIEARARDYDFTLVAINDLLSQAGDYIRTLANKQRVSVNIEALPASPQVECDSNSLHQVLMNLLENAVKYTPADGAITLGARLENDEVEFFVRDTGVGIPSAHIPRLFERFYRVDKARSRELGGTGLGLAIAKHLVLAHDGSVRVESEEGRGSSFYFRIPLQRSQKAVGIGRARGVVN